MPIYIYECNKCGGTTKVQQKMDDPAPKCCGKTAKKILGKTSFVLKGRGWFKDGY